MPYCPNCGTPVDDGATFCANCGTSIAGGQSAQPQQSQPPQGQPQQSQPPQGQPPTGGPPAGRRGAGSDDGISRRKLLAGGAGVAAIAGGGWFLFFRGPSGAAAVADDYINAIGDNDWEQAGALFHDASPPRQSIESTNSIDRYETYLREEGRTDVRKLREFAPNIESHEVWNHYTEYDQEAAEDLSFSPEIPPATVEEIKQISTVVKGDVTVLYDSEQSQHFEGNTSREAFFSTVVNDGSEWTLWKVFHPV